jgi:hypothetical protein
MPSIYTLIMHSKHGSETAAHLSEAKRDRQYRECLLEVAREEWCHLDVNEQEQFPRYLHAYLDTDAGDCDVMSLTSGEIDQFVWLCESNEEDWWEECDIEITPDEFRQFLFDNLNAFDVGLITELNALIAARETT